MRNLPACLCILIIVSAFGPYLLPQFGLRLDHFVVYGLLIPVILGTAAKGGSLKITRRVKWIFLVLLANVIWIYFSTCINILGSREFPVYATLAAFDGLIQPLVIILIVSCLSLRLDAVGRYKLLNSVFTASIVLLCLNTFLCAASVFWDSAPVLNAFHGLGDEAKGTVYLRAASMGRYSGIFNQPVESGLAYSLGLLFWVYLAVVSKRVSGAGWLALIFLLVGGVLSVSKLFILGGMPLVLALWLWYCLGDCCFRKSTALGFLKFGGLGLILLYPLALYWSGIDRFFRYFSPGYYCDRGIISGITAGRFGLDQGGLVGKFFLVWSESPFLGFGAFISSALDNAYLEFFYYGGLVSLFLYAAVLMIILFQSLVSIRSHPRLGKLLLAIWVLILGAGIGAPVFTLNRASILLWVAIVLIFSIVEVCGEGKQDRRQLAVDVCEDRSLERTWGSEPQKRQGR